MIARRRRSGFTLLEVLLVMAIMVILSAVALPSMIALYGDTRVRGAADEIRGAWGEARARAVDSGIPQKFAVMRGKANYRVAPDTPDQWAGSDSTADKEDENEKIGSLPKPIVFNPTDGEDAGGWVGLVTFLPDGTCKVLGSTNTDSRDITLSQDGGYMMVVSVRALTGSVSVKTKKQLENE